MAWASADADTARTLWVDAPLDDAVLQAVLAVAFEQCVAFAPEVATPTGGEEARFKYAQVMQARAVYRAGIAGGGDRIGGDGFSVTVFPMDWTVKALLRPAGRPVVG